VAAARKVVAIAPDPRPLCPRSVYSPAGGALSTHELWLVRHGETTASRDGFLAGWTDVPLTGRGEEQARSLQPFLAGNGFDGVFSSDLRRAMTTARLAWGEPTAEPRLREIGFGDLEGTSWDVLEATHKSALIEFVDFSFPGGECEQDVQRRVDAFLGDLPPGRYLLFTHGGVIRLLARAAGEDDFVPTGTVLALDWPGPALLFKRLPEQLLAFNRGSKG
jgi:probable phosphoglycerate mutase